MNFGTHFSIDVPAFDICGNRKSGYRRSDEHLAYGPPRSSSQNQSANTMTFVAQTAAAPSRSDLPLAEFPDINLELNRTRLIALERLTKPMRPNESALRFRDSLVILVGFEIASGTRRTSSIAGNINLGPKISFEGSSK